MNALVASHPASAASRRSGPVSAAVAVAAEPDQYLTFLLGGEMFAIGILTIKEIIEYRDLTTVPLMPASVRGVINLRGAVVPVIDLLARFGSPSSEVGRRTCIVIVEIASGDDTQVVGLVVDSVSEVLDIAAADIEPPPSFGTHIRSDFVQGMGKVREKFVILLNTERLFAFDELGAVSEAAAGLVA